MQHAGTTNSFSGERVQNFPVTLVLRFCDFFLFQVLNALSKMRFSVAWIEIHVACPINVLKFQRCLAS